MHFLRRKEKQMINRDRKNNLSISVDNNLSSSNFISVSGILNKIKFVLQGINNKLFP